MATACFRSAVSGFVREVHCSSTACLSAAKGSRASPLVRQLSSNCTMTGKNIYPVKGQTLPAHALPATPKGALGARMYSSSVDSGNEEATVLYTAENNIGTITLNNPRQRNPLSHQVLALLDDAIEQVNASQDGPKEDRVLAVVLQSTGTVFSSGHDFAEFSAEYSRKEHEAILDLCTKVNVGLQQCAPPVIASVQGMATAGGCQLVASCDLVVASEVAQFCVPGTKIGGFCHTPAVSLAEKIHPRKALEMLLLAEDVPAREAERIGLVNRVVAPELLEATVTAMAEKVAAASIFNMQMGKKAFYEQTRKPSIEEKYATAKEYMLDMFTSHDMQSNITAFLNKRAAKP